MNEICHSPISLPRLLYVGDVPVVNSVAGPLALYRLLCTYPADKLKCIHLQGTLPPDDVRLRGVEYESFPLCFDRLLRTRLHDVFVPAAQLLQSYRATALSRRVKEFGAEAVLTVVHGQGWLAAAALAQKLVLPLHLILHDGPRHWGGHHPITGPSILRAFTSIYRRATSRLCVSRKMEAAYYKLTGVPGTVLHPARQPDTQAFREPPPGRMLEASGPVAVYFGTINSPHVVGLLQSLSEVLSILSGRLILIGPPSLHVNRSQLLDRANVRHVGLLPTMDDIRELCRREATFLYLPFSFNDAGMSLSFPSKLIDYTTVGLPVLVQAPSSAPIADWIYDNRDAAMFVDSPDRCKLRRAIMELWTTPHRARSLAAAAADAGERSFDHGAIIRIFYAALQSCPPPSHTTCHSDHY